MTCARFAKQTNESTSAFCACIMNGRVFGASNVRQTYGTNTLREPCDSFYMVCKHETHKHKTSRHQALTAEFGLRRVSSRQQRRLITDAMHKPQFACIWLLPTKTRIVHFQRWPETTEIFLKRKIWNTAAAARRLALCVSMKSI